MSGRGRGRPPSRSAQEAAAGPSRRSTRHQQQHQEADELSEVQAQPDSPEQQLQQQLQADQEQEQEPQLEAAMSAPEYHQNIDPAISGPQDGGMPPPAVPNASNLRGQAVQHVAARRGTARNGRAPSMAASINSVPNTDAFSSQPEPQSTALQIATPARMLGTPARGSSVVSSAAADTPGRRAAKARVMETMLDRLVTAADDLFTHLCADQVDPEMWNVARDGFKMPFDAYRTSYVLHSSDPVVDPSFVADTMGVNPSTRLWSKVFRVASAANLAALLNEITPINQQDLLPLLQVWDSTFPDCFVGEDSDINDDTMDAQIIEQALMIRTHLTILTLEKLQADCLTPFHPLVHVAKIWCDGDVSVEALEAFLGDEDTLQFMPLGRTSFEEATAALAGERTGSRFKVICGYLPNHDVAEGSNLDLERIHDSFKLEEFVDNLRTFAKDCFGRIKALLQQDRVLALPFAPADGASRADSQLRSQLETDAMVHGFDRAESAAPSVSYDMNALRMMKQLEQQPPSAYGDGHQLNAGSYPPGPRIPYPPGFNSDGYNTPSQPSDFQPNGSIYAESAARVSGRKRGAQDEPAAAGDGAASSAPPAAKKARGRRKKKDIAAEAAMGPSSAAAAASSSLTALAAQSQYPPLPGTQDEPDFGALSQRTRELTAAARKVKEPQTRTPWVGEDIKLLIAAVREHQCGWSTIEKEIKAGTLPFKRPRDQQALRDKARLLKQDFLKADLRLPPGFDLVVLGKKEREAVKAVGKNPDRKEADVDENGQPIGTEYAPEGEAAPAAPRPAPLPPAEPQPQQQPEEQLQLQPQPEAHPALPEQAAA